MKILMNLLLIHLIYCPTPKKDAQSEINDMFKDLAAEQFVAKPSWNKVLEYLKTKGSEELDIKDLKINGLQATCTLLGVKLTIKSLNGGQDCVKDTMCVIEIHYKHIYNKDKFIEKFSRVDINNDEDFDGGLLGNLNTIKSNLEVDINNKSSLIEFPSLFSTFVEQLDEALPNEIYEVKSFHGDTEGTAFVFDKEKFLCSVQCSIVDGFVIMKFQYLDTQYELELKPIDQFKSKIDEDIKDFVSHIKQEISIKLADNSEIAAFLKEDFSNLGVQLSVKLLKSKEVILIQDGNSANKAGIKDLKIMISFINVGYFNNYQINLRSNEEKFRNEHFINASSEENIRASIKKIVNTYYKDSIFMIQNNNKISSISTGNPEDQYNFEDFIWITRDVLKDYRLQFLRKDGFVFLFTADKQANIKIGNADQKFTVNILLKTKAEKGSSSQLLIDGFKKNGQIEFFRQHLNYVKEQLLQKSNKLSSI